MSTYQPETRTRIGILGLTLALLVAALALVTPTRAVAGDIAAHRMFHRAPRGKVDRFRPA